MTMSAADIQEEAEYWASHPLPPTPPVDWRGILRGVARLALLAVGLVFVLAGLGIGLVQPGMWAALAVVGAALLCALVMRP